MTAVSAILFVVLTSLFSGESIPSLADPILSEEVRVTEQKDRNQTESDNAIMPVTSPTLLEGNGQ